MGLFQIHFSKNKDRNSGADVMDNVTKVGCGGPSLNLYHHHVKYSHAAACT